MKSKIGKTVIILLLLNLLAAGAYVYLFTNIRNTNYESAKLSGDIFEISASESRLKSTERLIGDIEEDLDELSTYFVGESRFVDAIQLFETIGKRADVALEITSVNFEEGENGNKVLSLRFDTSGSWNETVHFVSLIENSPLALAIKDTRLGHTEDEAGGFWRGTFRVEVLAFEEL